MKSHYTLLGVHRRSTLPTIKSAYRDLARIHHPDKGGDPEIFKSLNEAYGTLSDPEKRKLYDFEILSISDLFGSTPEPTPDPEPSTGIHSVLVSLEDLCKGTELAVEVSRTIVNERLLCRCLRCSGTGVSQLVPNLMGGFLPPPLHARCAYCTLGYVPESISTRTIRETIRFPVPAGCPPGMLCCFPGKGNQRPGCSPGDLVLCITCRPTGPFQIRPETLDLLYTLPISLSESLLGFVRVLDHPDGRRMRICQTSVTKPGRYTLPGAGICFRSQNRNGHLAIRVQVEFPAQINPDGKALWEILAQQRPPRVEKQTGDLPLHDQSVYLPTSVVDLLQKNRSTVYRSHSTPGCSQM